MQAAALAVDALRIGPLRDAECGPAAWLLARAFRDNPLNRAVIGQESPEHRLRSNRHGMRALLPVAQVHGCVLAAHLDGALAGVLVATPPRAYPLPPPPLWARLRCVAGQGLRTAGRWSHVFETVSAWHPAEPHAYLGTLGVDPGLQGRGVGGALLRAWLAAGEQAEHPAWLETDAPRNLGFYARSGFSVEGEMSLLGVRVWRMRRPPRR